MTKTRPTLVELRQVSPGVAEQYAAYLLSEVRETVDGVETVVKRAFSTNSFNKHVRLLELVFRVLTRKADLSVNPWADIARKNENKASRR